MRQFSARDETNESTLGGLTVIFSIRTETSPVPTQFGSVIPRSGRLYAESAPWRVARPSTPLGMRQFSARDETNESTSAGSMSYAIMDLSYQPACAEHADRRKLVSSGRSVHLSGLTCLPVRNEITAFEKSNDGQLLILEV
ncbi:MAG: hypothetical protein U9N55_03405 [candidate division Zixibacteria bacterium]|nr:hypothetical protein [candidate division Zixibacteria bacterium]